MATKKNTANEWDIAEQFVAANADGIRAAVAARSPKGIFDLVKEADLAKLWSKILTELDKQLDLDYKAFSAEVTDERRSKLTEIVDGGQVIELYTAGDAEVNSFAICDAEGAVLWYGEFHENDRASGKGDDAAAGAAIEKAIYLASEARKKGPDGTGLDGVAVTIVHSHPAPAPELPNLERRAVNAGLLVTFVHSETNPALDWCRENGYRSWRQVKLQNLFSTEPQIGAVA